MTCIAVFSNVAGIGKTTLVYHLGHMLADMGKRVLLVDCDPQAHLTSLCLPEERIEALWQGELIGRPTIAGYIHATHNLQFIDPHTEELRQDLALIPGDLALAALEGLFTVHPAQVFQDPSTTANASIASVMFASFAYAIMTAAAAQHADFVLLDLGPSLGSINCAAMVAADNILIPLTPSLQTIDGLHVLGPVVSHWRDQWRQLRDGLKNDNLPRGAMQPIGYVVTQTGMRLTHPVPSYSRWMARLPGAYRQRIHPGIGHPTGPMNDPECLGTVHGYTSLMPLSLDARKPMFDLRPADGAIGSHMDAVLRCRADFEGLAKQILLRTSTHPQQ